MLAVNKIKKDFPIFKRKINRHNLIYFDSAATSQKPKVVIRSISDFYSKHNANINRGIHTLSEESTMLYEGTRNKVAKFINSKPEEIIFTKNATESINLVVRSFVRPLLKNGDFILLTETEHHANLIPWLMLAEKTGVKIKYVPVDSNGILDYKEAEKLLSEKPKFFSFTYLSNVLGTINNAKKLTFLAHKYNVSVLIDACQFVPHMKIDVKNLDCDFLVFSSHKMFGPDGVGVLFGKLDLLKMTEPFLGGGDMVVEAYYDKFVINNVPNKFEAGTPNISGVVAFGNALDYLNKIGMNNIENHDKTIVNYAFDKISKIKNIDIYGAKSSRCALISFNLFTNSRKLIHPHDVSAILDSFGIAIRAGHHCCMPLHLKLNIPASCRVSFYIYNSKNEINFLVKKLEYIIKMFNGGVKNE